MSRSRLVVACAVVCLLAFPAASDAKGKPGGGGGGGGSAPTGYDISYPQCGKAFPSNVLFDGLRPLTRCRFEGRHPSLEQGDFREVS